MAEGAAGMVGVAVCFQCGEGSKPVTREIFKRAKEAIRKEVPHAKVTYIYRFRDYGK